MSVTENHEKELSRLRILLARKEKLEKALVDISIKFISPENYDHALNFALSKILECSNADRAVIIQLNSDNSELMSMTHEVCRKGVRSSKKHVQNIPYAESKWFEKTHREKGYIAFTDRNKLPEEAAFEKKTFKRAGISASVITSYVTHGKFRGNLAIHNKSIVKEWDQEIINMMIHVSVLIQHSLVRLEAERELIDAKLRAEESDKLKTNFLANLSHEIRTPINGIMGFTRLLSSRNYTPEKRAEYTKLVETNSKQLIHVIEDLVDLSKIETKSIELKMEVFSLRTLLYNLFDYYRVINRSNRNIEFKIQFPVNYVDVELKTDRFRLKQIIENLLKNSFKFTHTGTILMGCEIEPNAVKIYVEDTGIGIDQKSIPKLFDRFWQKDSTEIRPYGGNGIGLSIANNFAEMIGGQIKVNSEIGRGSRFTLSLPVNLAVSLIKPADEIKRPIRSKHPGSPRSLNV